jgi:hypothetical protein
MTTKNLKNLTIITATILTVLFSSVTTSAERVMNLPNQQQSQNQQEQKQEPIVNTNFQKVASSKYTVQFVKIDLEKFYGSGTIVSAGFLAKSGVMAGEGMITTTHIFQDQRIKDYLFDSHSYNISQDQTLKCKYSFGETLEYAVFVPIESVRVLENAGLISLTNLYTFETPNSIVTNDVDQGTDTNIVGAKSNLINLINSQVQSGDSGALIFQNETYLNTLGVQFGYSKNTANPYTVFWKLFNNNGTLKAKVNWLNNKQNQLEWQNGEFVPKNCTKAFDQPKQQPQDKFRMSRL